MRILRLQTAIEFRLLFRQRETVFFGLVLPLMFLFFVGVAFRSGVYRGYTSINSLLPPYLVMAIMSIAVVNLGISFATQRATGALKRFGGTPLPRTTLVLAKVLSSAVLIAVSCILLAVVSIGLYGMRTQGNPLWALLVLVIGIAAFAAIGIALGGSIAADGAAAVTNAIYLPLLFLGGSFVPVSKLPRPLADLAWALPPAHLVRALDTVLIHGQSLASTGWDLPIVAAWGLAAVLAASRWLSWE
ncbi:MAG TPA: ABC transporter permease [Chloroflexota bacterium]|nr:ABC transporter permease [Chloroflexota bacterium]